MDARGCGLVLEENKELSKALGGRAGQSANLENGKELVKATVGVDDFADVRVFKTYQ